MSKIVKKKPTKFFTFKKSQHQFNIDGKALEPTQLTLLNKSFRQAYYKQIESIIHNDDEDLNYKALYPILYLHEYILEGDYPVQIQTNLSTLYKKEIAACLNKFYNDNQETIKHLYEIFTSLGVKQCQLLS